MYPILFHAGGLAVYSYGFMIGLGAIAGVAYMTIQGKKEMGLTFDQSNALFLYIFIAAFIGGKVFLFLEEPALYVHHPKNLITGQGFVFYGSFLFAIPTMFWFFRRNGLDPYKMLDIMAITTCLVHMFGRVGCFLAGCCYGVQTKSILGVIFSDPACAAVPLGKPLHPTQLYEALYIFLLMLFLLRRRMRRKFYGELFLLYLIAYAVGRSLLEFVRGDLERGFIIKDVLSHSQLIALIIIICTLYVYSRWSKKNKIDKVYQPLK